MSLKTKIFARMAALIVVVVVSSGILYCLSATVHHRTVAKEHCTTTVISRGDDIERMISPYDHDGLQRMVDTLVQESSIGVVYALVEKGGDPYVHTFDGDVPRALLDRPPPETGAAVWEFADAEGAVVYDVAATTGESGAVLHLGLSRRKIDRALVPLWIRTALLGLAAILVGCLLSLLFARWATQEVDRLTAALEREKDFSGRLIDSSVDGIFAFDRECRYTLWNPGMERMTGVPSSETLGKVAFQVFSFLKETGEDRFFHEALAGNNAVAEDRPYTVAASGRKGFFDGRYSPLIDVEGSVVGGFALIRDVTARKQAEEALRESLRITTDIVQAIPSGLFVYRYEPPDRLFLVEGNPQSARITGLKVEDWVGKEFNEIWPRARETGLTNDFLAVIKTGEPYRSEDLWYEDTKLGGAFRVYAFRMPGNRLGVAFEDVTEQKVAKDQLAVKIKEIEDFNRLAVGRELKMIELKEEINALLKDQGRPPKYNIPK